MKKTDISFIAALIEGEGCITIRKPTHRKNTYFLRVTISNTAFSLLEFCRERFGGNVRFKGTRKGNKYKSFIWPVGHLIALNLLTLVYPYLISKRKQAALGIKFQKRVVDCGNPRIKEVSKKEKYIRNQMYLKMKELKSEGRELINKRN